MQAANENGDGERGLLRKKNQKEPKGTRTNKQGGEDLERRFRRTVQRSGPPYGVILSIRPVGDSVSLRAVATVFTLSAGETLPQLTEIFQREGASMPLDARRAHVLEMAHRFIDASVQGLVLGLITDGVGVSSFTESAMRGLASLVESVAGKLVQQVLKKASPDVLMDAGQFFVSRVMRLPEVEHAVIAVPMTPDNAAAIELGITTVEREPLVRAMTGVVDDSLDYLFDAAFAIIPVGPLTRRAVDAGGHAMRSGGKGASTRAIRRANDDELKDLAAFLGRRRAEVP